MILPICRSFNMIARQSLSLRYADPAPFAQGSLFCKVVLPQQFSLLRGAFFVKLVTLPRRFPLLGDPFFICFALYSIALLDTILYNVYKYMK